MPSFSPLINGKNYDWGDIQVVLFGIPMVGITEINYTRRRASTNNYGGGNEPVSYGNGRFEYEADISFYIDENINISNAAPNRSILEIPPFTIIVLMGGTGGTNPVTHILRNVRFLEDPFTAKEGDTFLPVKVPLAYAGLTK